MIDAKELRIGNWVQIAQMWQGAGYDIYRQCDIDTINRISRDANNRNPFYDPIPLTPEILEKCGFEINSFGRLVISINPLFQIGESLEQPGSTMLYCHNRCVSNNIRYLHQLQNLFFALAGKELEIQPL